MGQIDSMADDLLALDLKMRLRQERTLLKSVLYAWDDAWAAIDKLSTQEFDDAAFRQPEHRALWRAMRRARGEGASGHTDDLLRQFLRDKEIREKFSDMWGEHERAFMRFIASLVESDTPTIEAPSSIPAFLDATMRAHQRERVRALARSVSEGGDVEPLQKALGRTGRPQGHPGQGRPHAGSQGVG